MENADITHLPTLVRCWIVEREDGAAKLELQLEELLALVGRGILQSRQLPQCRRGTTKVCHTGKQSETADVMFLLIMTAAHTFFIIMSAELHAHVHAHRSNFFTLLANCCRISSSHRDCRVAN